MKFWGNNYKKSQVQKIDIVTLDLTLEVTCLTLDLLPFNKQLSENSFFRYFSLKNKSVARLCTDFLKKTIEKIYNSSNHFLKGNKSIVPYN